jgi:hypothetical protein
MKERDIRDRIAQFLKKTARTVVVPASVGLGVVSPGCDGHSLHGRTGDAGLDLGAEKADGPATLSDPADTAAMDDLPLMMVPYVVMMPRDAPADLPPEAPAGQSVDADVDVFDSPRDAQADTYYPVPPYLLSPLTSDELTGGAQEGSQERSSPAEKK